MNEQLQGFARDVIKDGLAQLTEAHHMLFKRMYAGGKMSMPITEVVDLIPEDRLSWAMMQVSNTLKKKEQKDGNEQEKGKEAEEILQGTKGQHTER